MLRCAQHQLPRLAFADIMVRAQGPAAQAVEVALRMLEAGVDAVGVHLQADARRADPTLIERDYLGDVARAIFERVGSAAPVQVVGGLSVAQAKSLAQAGLRAFVISGNLGQPDGRARYDLPRDQIERYVADFIAAVSSAGSASPYQWTDKGGRANSARFSRQTTDCWDALAPANANLNVRRRAAEPAASFGGWRTAE